MTFIEKVKAALHLGHHHQPVFDSKKVTVVFVLGGPGVGKGTQCERLVRDYGFVHLSAGNLLRAKQNRPGSKNGELSSNCIKNGETVPMEVTIKLLEEAIVTAHAAIKTPRPSAQGWGDGRGRFLVDGFPRNMDQAIAFDEHICLSAFVLFLSCTEEVMLERLLRRAKTSGRADDNEETIKKRFKTFEDTGMPVINYYRQQNKVVEVDATKSIDEVYVEVTKVMDQKFAGTGVDPTAGAS